MEINSLAYVKTTSEAVFVLGILPDGGVVVRRQVSAKGSFPEYRLELFRVEELESEEAHKIKVRDSRAELARELHKAGLHFGGIPGDVSDILKN